MNTQTKSPCGECYPVFTCHDGTDPCAMNEAPAVESAALPVVVSGFAIEKGVPLRPRGNGDKDGIVATLRAMQVGDSFLCDRTQRTSIYNTSISPAVRIKLAMRKEGGKVRVWRVA
jgi:hypothetical protein